MQKHSPEIKQSIVERKMKGEPIGVLAKEAGVSKQLIYQWVQAYKKRSNGSTVSASSSGTTTPARTRTRTRTRSSGNYNGRDFEAVKAQLTSVLRERDFLRQQLDTLYHTSHSASARA
jgi:transposase-like protein